MGLDQYAYHRRRGDLPEHKEEICYWRKHNRLEGWMEELYRRKTGDMEESFNCKELELTVEDLDQLEATILDRNLPATKGFFFGDDSYTDYEEGYKETDLEFIQKSKDALNSFGGIIIYTSWW